MRTVWPTETEIQCTVIEWCRLQRDGRRHAIHIPNEAKRSPRTGARLKREGMVSGASDIFIPMGVAGWHGFWLELKSHNEKPKPHQYQFLADMAAQGYATGWTDDADTAIAMITAYATGRMIRPNWVHFSQPAMGSTP